MFFIEQITQLLKVLDSNLQQIVQIIAMLSIYNLSLFEEIVGKGVIWNFREGLETLTSYF